MLFDEGDRITIVVAKRQFAVWALILVAVICLIFVTGVIMGKKLTGLAGDCQRGDLKIIDKTAELEKELKTPSQSAGEKPTVRELITALNNQIDTKPAAPAPKPEPPRPPPPKPVKEPVKETKKEPPPEKIAPAAEPASDAEFSLQVSAFPDRNQALSVAAQLERKGYKPHLSAGETPGKATMYRVQIGAFRSKDEANAFRQEFEKKEGMKGFVTSLK